MSVLLFLFLFATAAAPTTSLQDPGERQGHTILEIASADHRFDTLVSAVEAAGLTSTLSGKGPFTLFAPTDAAFRALPAGTLEGLLRPESKETLKAILTYHVVAGRVKASDLLTSGSAPTASGTRLPIGLSIGGARIVQTDIVAENGIIHVIDAVLLPPSLNPEATRAESSSSPRASALEIIALAISEGAPLYNRGDARACAAVYRVASIALASRNDLPEQTVRALQAGLKSASLVHSAEDQAWRLRDGLDAAYESLLPRRMSESAGR